MGQSWRLQAELAGGVTQLLAIRVSISTPRQLSSQVGVSGQSPIKFHQVPKALIYSEEWMDGDDNLLPYVTSNVNNQTKGEGRFVTFGSS